jgi:hypothetical protein
LKKTSSKGERREDENSSSGSDDLTEVEENQRNSTKNKSKHEKEEAARVRTLKKEQKASSSQAKKSIIIKRKRERKDKDKTVGTKKIKKEKHFQAKVLKRSKGERREDESSSSGSDDLTEVEEEQRNSIKNKSENLTDKNLETKQILKIGDYVVVKYDDKFYPGLIKATDREEYEVSVMKHSSNGKWKWPKLTDQIWYKKTSNYQKN